jgi:hypothetical protein
MKHDEAPLWAQELLRFIQSGLGSIEGRLTANIERVEAKIEQAEWNTGSIMAAFEARVTLKVENMELRIVERLENLDNDVAELKLQGA